MPYKTTLMERIDVLKRWPGFNHASDTTPTLLAYADDLNRVMVWGNVGDDHKHRCAYFKQLLHRPTHDEDEVDHMSPRLKATNIGSSNLPPGKSAFQVTSDFLEVVRQYIWKVLCRIHPEPKMKAHLISYVLTVPDLWSDRSKAEMLRAALNAGFPLNVELVTESTALGLYCAIMSEVPELCRGSKFIRKARD
jgi:molecular chaperone DnaK (HSP70)